MKPVEFKRDAQDVLARSVDSLRILTWNMNGLDKREACASLRADVSVFQELRKPAGGGELWFGDLESKGVGVCTSERFRAEVIPTDASLPKYFIPMQITGAEVFQFIAVWAMKNDGDTDRYVRGLNRAVDMWSGRIAAQPTVIAGDFNAGAVWDKSHPADRNFSALARKLEGLGLVSAYHAFTREAFGTGSRATFHLYRHASRPFHIDYCFVPREWVVRDVRVGGHEEWTGRSDHMPVTVDVCPGGPSGRGGSISSI